MKKYFLSLGLIAAAAFTLTNCTKEIDQPDQAPESAGFPFEITASTAVTKTVAGDEYATNWANNDALSVFHAEAGSTEYGENDEFTITAENLASNRFTGNLTESLDASTKYDWYVFYPYKSAYNTPANTSSGVVYLGSKYNEVQTQTGYDSYSHLAGPNFPLYGKSKNTPATETPGIAMSHLTSALKLTVTNTTSEPLTINQVSFTAPDDINIIGSYYISYAGEEVIYTPKSTYVNKTATLNVKEGTSLNKGESATFYIGFKPFAAESGDVLKMSVNGYEKELTLTKNVTFAAGHIKTMTFDYDKVMVKTVPYSESFENTMGAFSVSDKTLSDGLSYVWNTNSSYVKASAYVSSKDYAAESWLISPYINLEGLTNAYMSFEYAVNYFSDVATMEDEVGVKIRKQNGEWSDVEIYYPSELSWNWTHSGYISLSSVVGGNAQIAFVYKSTENKAGTWRIKNFKVDLKPGQLLSFSDANMSATVGENFDEPVLNGAETDVTYSSSVPTVATVNPSTGEVSIVGAGTTVITATAAETNEYFGASASYTINVAPAAGGYSYTFTATTFNGNSADAELNGLTWTMAGESADSNNNYYGYNGTKGQQFGKADNAFTSLTLSTSGFSGKVGNITINTSGAASIVGTVSVTVNGKTYGTSQDLTSTAADYIFEVPDSGAEAGTIVISWVQTSSKAIYLKSISIAKDN